MKIELRLKYESFSMLRQNTRKSLNDALHPSPNLQRELVDVFTRFRRAPVAISSDISQMFLQVGIMEKDHPFHWFLWRGLDQEKEPDICQFQRLPLGKTASPFCAQHALHSHAEKNVDRYTRAAGTIDNAMYVDDVLDSCKTVVKTITLRHETSELISSAGFTLKKWMSNEAKVIKDVPVEDRLPGLELRDGNLPTLNTLGVLWNALQDIFKFHVNSPLLTEASPTKRQVLSSIAYYCLIQCSSWLLLQYAQNSYCKRPGQLALVGRMCYQTVCTKIGTIESRNSATKVASKSFAPSAFQCRPAFGCTPSQILRRTLMLPCRIFFVGMKITPPPNV